MNGHLSPLAANVTNADDVSAHSESELSDIKDAPGELLSSGDELQNGVNHVGVVEDELSDSSHDEDAEGSDDVDYDARSPAAIQSPAMSSRSPSAGSRRPGKRKASTEDEEDFINKNPELYGLRRSVRPAECCLHAAADNFLIRGGLVRFVGWWVLSEFLSPAMLTLLIRLKVPLMMDLTQTCHRRGRDRSDRPRRPKVFATRNEGEFTVQS